MHTRFLRFGQGTAVYALGKKRPRHWGLWWQTDSLQSAPAFWLMF